MDQTLPIADEDPRGRPVVFRAGDRAENVREPGRRASVVRGAAVLGVAVSLLAGTTVVVSEVLAPSLPHAEAAPLWFRPPPLVDDAVRAGVPAAGPAGTATTSALPRVPVAAGDARDDGTPAGTGTDRTGPVAAGVDPDRRSGRTGTGDDARGPSRSGNGTGTGNGNGNGNGTTDSGKGTGNGTGSDSGKGTGTGSGKGTGNGNGSGKGTGSGSGRGSGEGTGHG